ncbi:pesticin C-terminus-like muramidase [Glaciecola sp. 1036]|uniref:pesticin C-terminus-like muramidase n=1 Tax=Alteromonadaceae TaxID=72275 RepID=UPI003CFF341D
MSTEGVKIDYAFIAELEGGNVLKGYVPDAQNSQSGVTLGIGFDLGARNIQDLMKLGLNPKYLQLLGPYLGLKGEQAQAYLQQYPIEIDEALANALNSSAKSKMIEQLVERYNADCNTAFVDIPAKWQTIIASVEFQYGSVKQRCPRFWRHVTRQDWPTAVKELRNFGDRYPTRRMKEADYALTL